MNISVAVSNPLTFNPLLTVTLEEVILIPEDPSPQVVMLSAAEGEFFPGPVTKIKLSPLTVVELQAPGPAEAIKFNDVLAFTTFIPGVEVGTPVGSIITSGKALSCPVPGLIEKLLVV